MHFATGVRPGWLCLLPRLQIALAALAVAVTGQAGAPAPLNAPAVSGAATATILEFVDGTKRVKAGDTADGIAKTIEAAERLIRESLLTTE